MIEDKKPDDIVGEVADAPVAAEPEPVPAEASEPDADSNIRIDAGDEWYRMKRAGSFTYPATREEITLAKEWTQAQFNHQFRGQRRAVREQPSLQEIADRLAALSGDAA